MGTDPFRQLLSQRIRALWRWLPGAGQCNPLAVHRARVASRRLRAVLPVVAAGRRGRALLTSARGLTRALGPVRELDVTLATLREFAPLTRLSRGSVDRVASAIVRERRALCDRVPRRLERCDLRRIGSRVLEIVSERSPREAAAAQLVDADLRGGRRAAQLRAAIGDAAGLYVAERLHAVRIAVKKCRYALELGQDLRRVRRAARRMPVSKAATAVARHLGTLRRVQKRLGRLHDLEVLIARVRALQGTAAIAGLDVSAELDQLVRRLEHECRDLHGTYIASRGDLLAVCDRAEAAAEKRQRIARTEGR